MKGEINYLGITTEFTWSSIEFYRNYRVNGKPSTQVLFGGFDFTIPTDENGLRFLEELLKIDRNFYDDNQPDPTPSDIYKPFTIKVYDEQGYTTRDIELLDAHIKNYREVFAAYQDYQGSTNTSMFIDIEVVSAIQRINSKALNVFRWHYSDFALPEYQSPVNAVEQEGKAKLCLEDGFYFSNKGEFIGRIGNNHKYSNLIFVFTDDLTTSDISSLKSEIKKTPDNEVEFRQISHQKYQSLSTETISKVVTTIFNENPTLQSLGIRLYNDKISIAPDYNIPKGEKFHNQAVAQVFYLGKNHAAVVIDKTNSKYGNYFNLVSDLYHELRHKYYDDKGIQTYGVGEIWVYIDQIEHSTYSKTSDGFKHITEKNFRKYLTNAMKAKYQNKSYLSGSQKNELFNRYERATGEALYWESSFQTVLKKK